MTATNLTETTVWYQTILKVAGEQSHLVVDGKFGPSTSQALTCFQTIWKLEPSGVLDVATNVALNQVAMEWIYRKLISTPLGKMTEELRDALKRFQSDYGLAADGQVGAATREVMVRVLRNELPSPLRNFHAHLGPGGPALTLEGVSPLFQRDEDDDLSGIHGGDDREPTATTLDRPFRWICRLRPEYGTTKFGSGSGLLISPKHVLTAAHVILDDVFDTEGRLQHMRDVSRLTVFPGYDGRPRAQRPEGLEPFKSWMGPGRQVLNCFRTGSSSCDFALVELEAPIGDRDFELSIRVDGKPRIQKRILRLGYWGATEGFEIRAVKLPELGGVKLFSAGYPHDFGNTQVLAPGLGVEDAHKKRVRELLPVHYRNLLYHTIDAKRGQSGSPAWRHIEREGQSVCQLVSVIIEKEREFNYAVALTEEVLMQIAKWAPETFEYKEGRLSVKK